MYAFGMMALLGLAILVVAKVGNHYLKQISGAWALVLVALGIGAAWLADLNLFTIWSIPVRTSGIGVTLTGILLAGVAYFWREILGLFGGLYRKYTDESKIMEHGETLRRVA
jgi:xanthine/uracil permease